MSMRSPVPGLL